MRLMRANIDQLDAIYNLITTSGNVPRAFTKSYLWEDIQPNYFTSVHYTLDNDGKIENILYHFASNDEDIFEEWLINKEQRSRIIAELLSKFSRSIHLNVIDKEYGILHNYKLSSVRREMVLKLKNKTDLRDEAIIADDIHKEKVITLLSQEWYSREEAEQVFTVTNGNPNGISKIIIMDKKVISFCHATYDKQKSWINIVFIDKEYRGKGFGRKTLESLLFTLRKMGINLVGLGLGEENTHAINLYKSLGFDFTDFIRWRYKIK